MSQSQGVQVQQGKPPVTPQQQAFLNLVTQASKPNNQAGIKQAQQQYVQTTQQQAFLNLVTQASKPNNQAGIQQAQQQYVQTVKTTTPTATAPKPTLTPTPTPQSKNVFAIISGDLSNAGKAIVSGAVTVGKDIVNAGNKATATEQVILNTVGIAASKAPSKTIEAQAGLDLLNFDVGQAGGIENQGQQAKNIILGAKTPMPFTPQNSLQKTSASLVPTEEAAAVAIVAPFAAPALGVGSLAATVGGVASEGVLINEAVAIGANEVITAIQGKSLLNPQNIATSAAEGAVFSVIGGGINQRLGIAGAKGLGSVFARVGVNVGLGAGAGGLTGYASTGKLQPSMIAQGAEFGLLFGVGGEIVNAAPNITGKIQDSFAPKEGAVPTGIKGFFYGKTLNSLQGIDEDFQSSINEGKAYQPTLPQRVVMRLTGLKPLAPADNSIVALPTITTEPTGTLDVSKEAFRLYGKNAMAASLADPTSTIYGKSIEPIDTSIRETQPPITKLPTYIFNGKNLVEEPDLFSFTGGKEATTAPNENIARVGNFAKPPMVENIKDIANLKNFPSISSEPETYKGPATASKGYAFDSPNDQATAQLLTGKVDVTEKDAGIGINKILGDIVNQRTVYNPYPGTARAELMEEEESPLVYPTILPTPSNAKFVIYYRSKTKENPIAGSTPFLGLAPSFTQRGTQKNRETPRLTPKLTPRITPTTTPVVTPRTTPTTTPVVTPITTPTTTENTLPIYPEPTKQKTQNPFIPFPIGGGGTGRNGLFGKSRYGRFYEVRNPVITPKIITGRFIHYGKNPRPFKASKAQAKRSKKQRKRRGLF